MNGAAFDFDGDIIRFQNTVARELGANQEQASYHSFMSGTDSRFGEFHVGHNYYFGVDVEIVRIGARPGHTVDNMDMSNRTDSPTTLMFGLSGNDTLRGSDGVDILYGGAGADRLYGGQGDVFLVFDGADRTIDGGDGFDTAVFATVYAADGSAQGQTIDVTRYRNATIERVYGTEGDDVVTIGDGDYVFDGRGGDDHITVSGRSAITIEFGVGGGHDYVEGIFMENHDFNAQVLHGQGPNTWFPDRENDTIRFVDLMPSDVSLVWNYTTQIIDVFGRESRDGEFAIVINETGESIQFAELFCNFDTSSYGIRQYACYGQYARNSDMYEDDPDNYLYSGPDGIDNQTHYDLFEFADGQRYSLFDLFDLLATQSSALPASRANPNAASSAANADFASTFEMHVSNPMATNLALEISTVWEPIDQICVV